MAEAGARAVLVRPDRYVLAFLSSGRDDAARLRALLGRYPAQR